MSPLSPYVHCPYSPCHQWFWPAGRALTMRALLARPDSPLEVVAINDLGDLNVCRIY